MRILGIDTTTKFLCLGIYDNAKVCEYNLELGTRQATLLVPTIKRVLVALGWRLDDIDYFACGLGPGSFTGIRVGLAVIKGLSWPRRKPVIGISTLDILARNVNQDRALVVPAVDAKRNLIYASIYKTKNGMLKRVAPYMLLTEMEFLKKVPPNAVIVADAAALYGDKIITQIKGATILDRDYWCPKGRNIIYLALERIRGKKLNTAFDINPIYLYPKECQIRVKG